MADHSQNISIAKRGRAQWPPVELGLSSVILGVIGLALFIVPIIGIPISVAAIVVAVAGFVVSLLGGQASLRLCVAGILLALCGLTILGAISRAPRGYFAPRAVFPTIQPAPRRPYIPPPALPPGAIWRR